MKTTKTILLFILFSLTSNAQVSLEGIGGYAGLGNIKGNSPAVTSFTSSLFIDIGTWLDDDVDFRFAFFYARKLEAVLPDEDRTSYFPFHKGYSLKAVIEQPVGNNLFFEEGIGLLALNDRTFSDTNEWGYGIVFSVLAGLDFRNRYSEGVKTGIGFETGNTFTNTAPTFLSVHLQVEYFLGD